MTVSAVDVAEGGEETGLRGGVGAVNFDGPGAELGNAVLGLVV